VKRENRYIVFKMKDCLQALTSQGRATLSLLAAKVHFWRKRAGKLPLKCVVVESDWPEYEPTWKAIEARVDGEERKTKKTLDTDEAPEGCRAKRVKEGEVNCRGCVFEGFGGCGDRKFSCCPDGRKDGCFVIFVKQRKRK